MQGVDSFDQPEPRFRWVLKAADLSDLCSPSAQRDQALPVNQCGFHRPVGNDEAPREEPVDP